MSSSPPVLSPGSGPRMRHFSAPAAIDLKKTVPILQFRSELQLLRLSLKKSMSWSRRSCQLLELDLRRKHLDSAKELDETPEEVPESSSSSPTSIVNNQTTCHHLPNRSLTTDVSKDTSDNDIILNAIMDEESQPSQPHGKNSSAELRRELPPTRWPSETIDDPGGGPTIVRSKTKRSRASTSVFVKEPKPLCRRAPKLDQRRSCFPMNIATKASSPFKRQLLVILFYFSIILSAAIRPADGKSK